jgi:hypothetical protein
MLGILTLRSLPAQTGRGGALGAVINGDVDCDGKLTINDPVKLLNFLFLGGPEPCALAQAQTTCCPEVTDRLDKILAALQTLKPVVLNPEDRWVINGDGTTTDTLTGLMWQTKNVYFDINLDGNPDHLFNYNQAKFVIDHNNLAGHNDWRLPTYKDFASLFRYLAEKPYNANSIPEFELPMNLGNPLWTSTQVPGGYYVAVLSNRSVDPRSPDDSYDIVLVRNTQ